MYLFRGTAILRELEPRNGWRCQEPTGVYLYTVIHLESDVSWTYRMPEDASQFYDAVEQNLWKLPPKDFQQMTEIFHRSIPDGEDTL
jgi:hypothetical protein